MNAEFDKIRVHFKKDGNDWDFDTFCALESADIDKLILENPSLSELNIGKLRRLHAENHGGTGNL